MFSHANKESLVLVNNGCVDTSRLNCLYLDQVKICAREARICSGCYSVLLCKNYFFHLPKALPPNSITLGFRVSTFEFCGGGVRGQTYSVHCSGLATGIFLPK